MDGYTSVTELPGQKLTEEQLGRMCRRYYFAGRFCKEKDVLEVACGAGQGLGYLAKLARKVVGGDIDENILQFARRQYAGHPDIQLLEFDAQDLPFSDNSFDVVICFEALYYFPQPEKFFEEAERVLRNDGALLISMPNKDWEGCIKSPFSYTYFSTPELDQVLRTYGFSPRFYGDCPVGSRGLKDSLVSFLRLMANYLHVVPKTMKGKEFFKRVFYGNLIPFPTEIKEGVVPMIEPEPLACDVSTRKFKVIFVEAHVKK